MINKIITDHFSWNILSWGALYISTIFILGAAQILIIKNSSEGLVYKEPVLEECTTNSKVRLKKTALMSVLIENCMDIWFNAPLSDFIAIFMLILFFVVTLISH